MNRTSPIGPMWQNPPRDAVARLGAVLDKARPGCRIFFRADDAARVDAPYLNLADIFKTASIPLSPAVVPVWFTEEAWQELKKDTGSWCWHQHGYAHVNHEPSGKKWEFGPARGDSAKRGELATGMEKLGGIMGGSFRPIFTPPWNRMDESSLIAAKDLGFKAVSRSRKAKPPSPAGLPDLFINLDLHTRKAADQAACWREFFAELEAALATGLVGVMIHHLIMNRAAFDFLAAFLDEVNRRTKLKPLAMHDLLG